MPVSSAHTPEWIALALDALRRIYKKGYVYKKAGVMLTGIEHVHSRQLSLLDAPAEEQQQRDSLMQVLDSVNQKWGRNTLHYAAAGLGRPWSMRQLRKSPRYTTCWQELPTVG